MLAPLKLLLILLLVLRGASTARAIPQDFEAWVTAVAFIPIEESKTYQIFLETQPRLGDDWHRMAAVLSRVALVYNPTSHLSVFAGYAWFPTFYDADYHRSYRDDQRLWQQVVYRHNLYHISWQHRLRQEQRWIEHTDAVSNRTRYRLRGSLSFDNQRDLGITGFNEIMVNNNGVNGGPQGGYDRNRIFAGPYWQAGPTRYEFGYLGEHARRFGDDARWINALATNIVLTF